MHKTNAIRLLDRHKVAYESVPYPYDENNLEVTAIAKNLDLPPKQIYKTLVAKGNKTGILVALVPGDCQLDFRKLSKATGDKKVRLIPVADLKAQTGYVRGGCSPLGMKKPFPIYIHSVEPPPSGPVYVNAGQRGLLIRLLFPGFGPSYRSETRRYIRLGSRMLDRPRAFFNGLVFAKID